MRPIDTPNEKVVNSYLLKWDKLEKYSVQEKSLNLLFNNLCTDNVKIENVLLKVSVLNDFYSTNIFDTYAVSQHILSCNIDKDIEEKNIDLVNKIALITIGGKTRNFYSFASKYCSHHRPDIYPIYDAYVEKMLMYFKNVDGFSIFYKYELKSYKKYLDIINKFRVFYNLENFSLRKIDIYLWLLGKEFFKK